MKTINMFLTDPGIMLQIGRRGENEVTEVKFDYSAWVDEFGPGVVSLLVRRSKDNSAYPVVMTAGSGNIVIWTITSTDTQYVGAGRAELIYTVDEQIAKSVVYKTNVLPDIGEASDTPPDPYETWLETLVGLGAEVEGYAQDAADSADAAEAAVQHYPYIGADNYWYVWDSNTEQFVNTNVKAEGVDGTDGVDGRTILTASIPPESSGQKYYYFFDLSPSGVRAKKNDIIIESDSCDVWLVTSATSARAYVSLLCNFKGDPGTDGTDGTDGYSPTVTVTEITGGHEVTITDVNGDHTFDVMDGTGGGGGTSDYDQLSNRPQINSHTLTGNQSAADLGLGTYSKPSGGIPSSDMASAVQTSLGKADTAYQKPSGGIPAADLASGVIPTVPSGSDSNPSALGTASPGSSAYWSRGDHVHKMPSASDVGLGNVDNVQQYSANNPPPYPVTSVNGSTGAVTLSIPSTAGDVGAIPAPASPSAGDVLTYSGSAWAASAPVHELPAGGNAGAVLAKSSASDYQVYWRTISDYTAAGIITTAAVTSAKVCQYSFWDDTHYPQILYITLASANTAASALTLKVNGKGPYPIYINGAASSATNYTLPAGAYVVVFDGTNFYFDTTGKIPAAATDPQEVTVSTAGAVSQSLDAGKIYHFTGDLTSLTITLNAAAAGVIPQYHFDFDSGSTAPTFPPITGVTMYGGTFTPEANKHYEVDILNNYGVSLAW